MRFSLLRDVKGRHCLYSVLLALSLHRSNAQSSGSGMSDEIELAGNGATYWPPVTHGRALGAAKADA